MTYRVFGLAILLGLTGACGGGSTGDDVGDDADDGDDGDDAPGADADPGAPDGPLAVTCADKEAQPVDATWTVAHGGMDRTVQVHVPASYDPTRETPVVLVFHGYTQSGSSIANLSRFVAKADAEGFIVAFPEGTGALRGWNAGACCGTAASSGVDDVGFVGALLDEMEARLCVDSNRVHATGFSNGGFLSHRLACELANRIASVAPVSGVMGITTCNPVRPIAVMHVHGTSDSIVPYNGNPLISYPPVATTIGDWVARNSCGSTAVSTFMQGDAACEAYPGCAEISDVELCTITGGGHQWPGGIAVPGLGHTSTDLDATDRIWDFFVAHPGTTLL